MRLSEAQRKALRDCYTNGVSEVPWWGGRNAGRMASAWWRTFESLRGMGLVEAPIKVDRVVKPRSHHRFDRVVKFVPRRLYGRFQLTDAGRNAVKVMG
jgi:hypothetical protein